MGAMTEKDQALRLSAAAAHVAEFAASASNRAIVALFEAKVDAVKEELANCEPESVTGLQAQIRLIRALITVANGHPEGI